MTFKNPSKVNVSYFKREEKIPVGTLLFKNRTIYFEYDFSFLEMSIELSPFKLPLKSGVTLCKETIFDGLFGVFNDSLPDGWGRLLLDRKLRSMNINPGDISPLARLCYVGNHGMGALGYEPEMDVYNPLELPDLDAIAEEAYQAQQHDSDTFIDELLVLNGSSTGARPKIMMNVGREHWIIKFRSLLDPKDIANIEYAYHAMAKEAGLDVPEAKLFPSKNMNGYFGIKRFDRLDNQRIHMHTISGLLHADHRLPCLDYKDIIKATIHLTKDINEIEKQYRAAVFNILSHNRDDHAKNFSFILDQTNTWRVSPAYDLTFSSGPAGEHSTMIMGEGKSPKHSHLLQLATVAGIEKNKAQHIIDEVKNTTANWNNFAKAANVGYQSTKLINDALNKLIQQL